MCQLRREILGNTGLKVSKLCIGTDYRDVYCGSLGCDMLLKGFSLGVNFWDSSESYGSYPAIREALETLNREEIVITSKSYSKDRDGAREHLKEALNEINTEYLDRFMLHAVDTLEDFNMRKDVLQFLLEAKRRGVVRAVGASTHSANFAHTLADIQEIEVVLAVLNMKGLNIRENNLKLMESAVKKIYHGGKGIYLMKVLARARARNNT